MTPTQSYRIPLLILSDGPTAGTGLARITLDLATRINQHLSDIFEVGTIGYGGPQRKNLGFPYYGMDMADWVVHNLPDVWQDFAGDRKGIVLTVWDASRMLWFSRPENCEDTRLRKFLTNPPFKRWGYFPIDASGPNDKLSMVIKHTIEGYDRILAYSAWAEAILRRTLDSPKLDGLTNLPHGIDTSVFKPRNRAAARHGIGERIGARTKNGNKWVSVPDDALMVGIVATNNPRKDFGLGIATVAELAKERKVFVWIHTDVYEKHWSIPTLLYDFGLHEAGSNLITIKAMPDEQMSWMYSACDVTLGIGMAEGFGYCIFESLACGTPCLHCNYGGAAEHLPESCLADPSDDPWETPMRLESPYNCYRPVHDPIVWAGAIERRTLKAKVTLPAHLDWTNLWPRWAEWLKAGVE